MIRKFKLTHLDGSTVEFDVYYKDGVEQTEKNAFDYYNEGAENISRDVFTDKEYDEWNDWTKVSKNDLQYKPRPYMWRYGKKRVIVQCNSLVPQEYWNIEMWNYEKEQAESKWHT